MSKNGEILNRIKQNLLPVHDGCFTSEQRPSFVIIENGQTGRAEIVNQNSLSGFKIDNPQQKQILMVSIDGCLLDSRAGKRCDCLVFDNADLCFVELKLNVSSFKQSSSASKEAREQLEASISYFKTILDELLTGMALEAFIVMKEQVYPRVRANRSNLFVSFQERTGVSLYEKNHKQFG